jgi:hypothetical protein
MAAMVVTRSEPPRKHPARAEPRGGRSLTTAGQATVEFVALLPLLALVALALGQAASIGWTAWSAAGAARVAARAAALGEDPAKAARGALPAVLGRRVRVTVGAGSEARDRTTVRLRVPSLVPGVRFGTVSGSSELPSQVAGA